VAWGLGVAVLKSSSFDPDPTSTTYHQLRSSPTHAFVSSIQCSSPDKPAGHQARVHAVDCRPYSLVHILLYFRSLGLQKAKACTYSETE
jgi:hypothetical protein